MRQAPTTVLSTIDRQLCGGGEISSQERLPVKGSTVEKRGEAQIRLVGSGSGPPLNRFDADSARNRGPTPPESRVRVRHLPERVRDVIRCWPLLERTFIRKIHPFYLAPSPQLHDLSFKSYQRTSRWLDVEGGAWGHPPTLLSQIGQESTSKVVSVGFENRAVYIVLTDCIRGMSSDGFHSGPQGCPRRPSTRRSWRNRADIKATAFPRKQTHIGIPSRKAVRRSPQRRL